MFSYDSQSQNGHDHTPPIPTFDPAVLEGLPLPEASALLKRELHRSILYIASIQRCRNALVRVNRLPDDVLAAIFIQVRDAMALDVHSYNGSYWGPNPYGVLCLGHVCNRWRQAIFSDPLLWTQIHIIESRWEAVTLFCRLSRLAMVEICYRGLTLKNADRFTELIKIHGHRISSLDLGSNDHLAIQRILSQISPLCNIKHLVIQAPTMSPHRNRMPYRISPVAGRWSLNSLTLFDAILSFDPPVYRSLRKLHISWHAFEPRLPDFTAGDILQVLHECPDLEDLDLELRRDKELEQELEQPTAKAVLPRLKNMVVNSEPREIAYLLSHLVLPGSTYVSLCTPMSGFDNSERSRGDYLVEFLHRVPPIHSEIPCLSHVTSLLVEKDGNYLHITGKRSERLTFDVTIRSCQLTATSSLLPLTPFFSVETLRTLTLQSRKFEIGTQGWLALFSLLPNLSTLVLYQTRKHFYDVIPDDGVTLIGMALGGAESPSSALPCPALEELEIQGISFLCDKEMEIGIALYGSLASRSAKGASRLKRLSFSEILDGRISLPQLDLGKFCDEVTFRWREYKRVELESDDSSMEGSEVSDDTDCQATTNFILVEL